VVGQRAVRRDWPTARGVNPGTAMLVTVAGDSRAPGLRGGDLALIDQARDSWAHNAVFARVDLDGAVRIKRIRRDKGAALRVHPVIGAGQGNRHADREAAARFLRVAVSAPLPGRQADCGPCLLRRARGLRCRARPAGQQPQLTRLARNLQAVGTFIGAGMRLTSGPSGRHCWGCC
jgi:hypothetical protein